MIGEDSTTLRSLTLWLLTISVAAVALEFALELSGGPMITGERAAELNYTTTVWLADDLGDSIGMVMAYFAVFLPVLGWIGSDADGWKRRTLEAFTSSYVVAFLLFLVESLATGYVRAQKMPSLMDSMATHTYYLEAISGVGTDGLLVVVFVTYSAPIILVLEASPLWDRSDEGNAGVSS